MSSWRITPISTHIEVILLTFPRVGYLKQKTPTGFDLQGFFGRR